MHIPHPNSLRVVTVSDDQKLQALEARISAAKTKAEPRPPREDRHNKMADIAWRMVLELVAGIAFGVGIGLGLDTLFGTMPIFLILFTLFGFAGGVRMMMRTAKEVQESSIAAAAAEEKTDG